MDISYNIIASSDVSQELQNDVIDILYSEWAGNKVERLSKLKLKPTSNSGSFVLLKSETNKDFVVSIEAVGHGELKPGVSINMIDTLGNQVMNAIALSVIIKQKYRSCGIGKILMTKLEQVALEFGYAYLYLWTDTAVNFYKKCSYYECESLSIDVPAFHTTKIDINKFEKLLFKRLQLSTVSTQLKSLSSDNDNMSYSSATNNIYKNDEGYMNGMNDSVPITQQSNTQCTTTASNTKWLRKRLKFEFPISSNRNLFPYVYERDINYNTASGYNRVNIHVDSIRKCEDNSSKIMTQTSENITMHHHESINNETISNTKNHSYRIHQKQDDSMSFIKYYSILTCTPLLYQATSIKNWIYNNRHIPSKNTTQDTISTTTTTTTTNIHENDVKSTSIIDNNHNNECKLTKNCTFILYELKLYPGFPICRQIGPSCGIAALTMIFAYFEFIHTQYQYRRLPSNMSYIHVSESISHSSTSSTDWMTTLSSYNWYNMSSLLLQSSLLYNYSYDGELFNIYHVAHLIELYLIKYGEMFSPGHITYQLEDFSVIKSLYSKTLSKISHKDCPKSWTFVLVPYDRDWSNNYPCQKNGHHAHYAVIIGSLNYKYITQIAYKNIKPQYNIGINVLNSTNMTAGVHVYYESGIIQYIPHPVSEKSQTSIINKSIIRQYNDQSRHNVIHQNIDNNNNNNNNCNIGDSNSNIGANNHHNNNNCNIGDSNSNIGANNHHNDNNCNIGDSNSNIGANNHHNDKLNPIEEDNENDLYLIAVHGMSSKPIIDTYKNWYTSNKQLKECKYTLGNTSHLFKVDPIIGMTLAGKCIVITYTLES